MLLLIGRPLRCRERAPFRERQAQFGKTAVSALNHGQNPVARLDRVTVSVDQPCFDDQPHGFLSTPHRSLLHTKPLPEAHAALLGSLPNFCTLSCRSTRAYLWHTPPPILHLPGKVGVRDD
ncbi:hypothetical protein P3T23_002948 [Paraburkholderia sp. GAS448]